MLRNTQLPTRTPRMLSNRALFGYDTWCVGPRTLVQGFVADRNSALGHLQAAAGHPLGASSKTPGKRQQEAAKRRLDRHGGNGSALNEV